ncbi:MAG TPA: Uma2 family endonuclease [Candidatus Riflebacteria bacterium]|jgi:Uma2 family endonuclease|nr:Uma2 family endonuclease [Candidatus Riflebacteria bacterium]
MVGATRKRKQQFTYGDLCTWPEGERWEIIDGIAYDMSPAPLRIHAELTIALVMAFGLYLRDKPCKVYTAPFDVRLPDGKEHDNEVKNVVQPDILVVCDEKKLDEKGCRGAPDLVIEILSPSTASKDCIQKRNLYEQQGVKEFWTVDPTNRLVHVYVLGPDGQYGKPAVFTDCGMVTVSIFDDLKINLRDVFPRQLKVVRESPRKYMDE